MSDVRHELHFYRSFWKLLFYFLLVLVLAVGCALAAFVEFELDGSHTRAFWLMLAGAAFFGLGVLVMLRDLVFGGRHAVILRLSGLTDERESRSEIPWSLVDSVYEVKAARAAKFIGLRLRTPASAEEGGASNDLVSRSVRMWRGAGDVVIASSRLNVSHADLLEHITNFWKAGQSYSSPTSSRPTTARAAGQFGRRARA